MKTLDLYFMPPSVAKGTMQYNLSGGMSDREFLEKEIVSWLMSPERERQMRGEAYYNGEQDILHRKRTVIDETGKLRKVENLPNNRIVDNQYAKMVDQKANYLCGKQVTFDVQNKRYGNALSGVFSRKVQRILRIVAEKALTGGKAWVFPHIAGDGSIAFEVLSAYEILPFWADAAHTELDCAVHFFPVYEYQEDGKEKVVDKVEVLHGGGVERFIWENGHLIPDVDEVSGAYITVKDKKTGVLLPLNWQRIPLICFKYCHQETPLLCRVRGLQDALNMLLSNCANTMEEDVHNTVLVVHNYDGENLGQFRRNLATYGAVKVRTVDGCNGGVDALKVDINAETYKTVAEMLKKAIIDNARGYDAKDERMSGTPNQMNIRSMYSDIDLDANGMETEFQAAFEELLWFVNMYLANTGIGNFSGEEVSVIFNRDILVNESEAIDNCGKSQGIISSESILKQHPWVDDPEREMERMAEEQKSETAAEDPYRAAFMASEGKQPE